MTLDHVPYVDSATTATPAGFRTYMEL